MFFILPFTACKTTRLDTDIACVPMTQSSTSQSASELLAIEGFTVLKSDTAVDLSRISKIMFKNDKAIVLNYNDKDDKQDIWVFDTKSGLPTAKIGQQDSEAEGYEGLNDIALDGNEIKCSVAGKKSFFNYNLAGKLNSRTPSGVFGEELEYTPEGWVVYNEYNSTDVSGLNHLVFYDRKGKVTKSAYPYLKAQDGNGYAFAGSLTASNGLWFNPPFCDTVFEIKGSEIVPRYMFDFGERAMPEQQRQKKMTGWDTAEYSFLDEGFAKMDQFVVFQYYDNHRLKLGMFDEEANQFVAFRDLKKDPIYELIQVGRIYPKDKNSFALKILPCRIRYLVNNNLLDLTVLSQSYPALANALKSLDNSPILLYLSFKPKPSRRVNRASIPSNFF